MPVFATVTAPPGRPLLTTGTPTHPPFPRGAPTLVVREEGASPCLKLMWLSLSLQFHAFASGRPDDAGFFPDPLGPGRDRRGCGPRAPGLGSSGLFRFDRHLFPAFRAFDAPGFLGPKLRPGLRSLLLDTCAAASLA